MPIYMDIHVIPGVKARDVAEAHQKDLFHASEYGCKCMTYWIDEERENVFCLIDAPDKETVNVMHNRAHGLIANKIIEVSSSLVESFLGRIYDPDDAAIEKDGLKVFADPSYRILLVTKIIDPVLLQNQFGAVKTLEFLNHHNNVIRKNISFHGGREVELNAPGFIISFDSATKAVNCALQIQNALQSEIAESIGFKMSLHAGEPVETSDQLFGDTIQFAGYLCGIAKNKQLIITSDVRDLLSNTYLQNSGDQVVVILPRDKSFLEVLFGELEKNWQNPELNLDDYCRSMALSKSRLYRKTIELTGLSPNNLLKEFRLEKAKDLIKKQSATISQVTFDSGFSSPSYFTKCFKKKYGLLPMAYLDLLH